MISFIKQHTLQLQKCVRTKWQQTFSVYDELDEEKLDRVIALVDVALGEADDDVKRATYKLFSEQYDYVQETMRYVQLVEEAILDILLQSNTHSNEEISIFLRENHKKLHEFERSLITYYERKYAYTVNMQKIALKELSTPIIPILDNIAVLPLVGAVDATRAKLIIEKALDGIRKYRAEVLLVDITGVPFIDDVVAHYIIQAIKAVDLLGTKCIIVGIKPEMAHQIVSSELAFDKFLTAGTLQRGFAEALRLTNRKIDEV